MFSENRKISERQIRRLLVFDIMGISTLLLPPLLAETAGRDGIFCIFLALIPAYLFLAVIKRLSQKAPRSYPAYMRKVAGKVPAAVLLFLYYLCSVFVAGYVLYTLTALIRTTLLKEETFWLVSILLLLAGSYGMISGMEGRARIYEILFWFLLAPLLLMLLLAAGDVNMEYWTPVLTTGWGTLLSGTMLTFLFYSIIGICLFAIPFEAKRGDGIKAASAALVISAFLNAVIYLVTLGMFAEQTLAGMRYPVITLMSMVRLPGGFFQRQDAFMVAIWFFALYALMNSGMFYGREILKELCGRKREKWYVWLTVILTYATAVLFYRSAELLLFCEQYAVVIAVAYLVLLPCLLLLSGRRKNYRKFRVLALLLVLCTGLTACSGSELEERSFPLALGIDAKDGKYSVSMGFQNLSQIADEKAKGNETTPVRGNSKSWHQAFWQSNADSPKEVDYNHLKAVIISRTVLEDEKMLTEFLDYVKNQELFARNTLLFTCEGDAADITEMEGSLDAAVGTYLEMLIGENGAIRSSAYVTLGSLLNEYDNRMENLYLPYITVEEDKPVIKSYYLMSALQAGGLVTAECYKNAMLLEGKLTEYELETASKTAAALSGIEAVCQYENRQGRPVVTVLVKADARLLNQTIRTPEEQDTCKKELETYLEERAMAYAVRLKEKTGFDLSNSYYKRGGYNRELYALYQGAYASYEKDLTLKIKYQITPVLE